MQIAIPAQLVTHCKSAPERSAWLSSLPALIAELQERWALTLDEPFDGPDVSCAWVAKARRADGTAAVLKLGMPHMEGAHEIAGLRFWNGDQVVRLLAVDEGLNAMLLERCEPGDPLRSLAEPAQDVVLAQLLRRLWRVPRSPHPFRDLSEMIAYWSEETRAAAGQWHDPGIVRHGLEVFEELLRTSPQKVLLATDLHAGNILRAQRQPWLVIDPKPFVGDAAYDATQHLFNCLPRLRSNPDEVIRSFAGLLDVDGERVRLWMFARLAAEPRSDWTDRKNAQLARMLAPH